MAIENNPNDPYDRDRLRDPIRTNIGERRSPVELDNELQPDPELMEGPAGGMKIAVLAVGIAVVLAAVFYGLNHTSVNQQNAATKPISTTAQNSTPTPPPAPPRANSQPGTTTGAAPATPQTPSPSSTAPGGANTNNANPSNAPASK